MVDGAWEYTRWSKAIASIWIYWTLNVTTKYSKMRT